MPALGPFTLLEQIAKGGMGEVWLAHQRGIDDVVVVKTVRPDKASADGALHKRFRDEMRTAVLLAHPCIVRTLDAGTMDDVDYIALEVVEGIHLGTLIQRAIISRARLPESVALYAVASALDGLAFAHELTHPLTREPLRVVHRDISPQNVMVSASGAVKVIDFGVALSSLNQHETATGMIPGKLAYMAPEQANGEEVDQKVDVYSCAMTLCEAIAHQRFYGDMPLPQVAKLSAGGYVPAYVDEFSADVQQVVRPALSADRNQRPTAAVLRDQLMALLATRGGAATAARTLALSVQLLAKEEIARVARARAVARAPEPSFDEPSTISVRVEEAAAIEAAVKRMHEVSSNNELVRAVEEASASHTLPTVPVAAPGKKAVSAVDAPPPRTDPDTLRLSSAAMKLPPEMMALRAAATAKAELAATVPEPASPAPRGVPIAAVVGGLAGMLAVVVTLVVVLQPTPTDPPQAAPPPTPAAAVPPAVPPATVAPVPDPPAQPDPRAPVVVKTTPTTDTGSAAADPLCGRIDAIRSCANRCAATWKNMTCARVTSLDPRQREVVERSFASCEAQCAR